MAATTLLAANSPAPAQNQASAPLRTGELAIAARPGDLASQPAATTPATSAADTNNGLRLNFRSAPLKLVLDYLSDAAGFVINQETDVRGTFDVWSKDAVSKEEAVQLLNSVLRHNGYGAVRNGRILNIISLENIKTADLEVVTGSNPDSVSKSDEVVTQIIPVRYATATQLVNNLQPLLPSTTSLSVNESANSLILVAAKKDIRRVLKIVSALDSSVATVSTLTVFPLHYADAKQLGPVLQQLFSPQSSNQNQNQRGQMFTPGPGGFGPGGFGPPGFGPSQDGQNNSSSPNTAHSKIVVAADEPSNSLIVSAAPDLLPSISNVVQQIDRPVSEITELRVFKLANADAAEIADQLSQLFPDNTRTGSDQAQSNVRFGGGPFGGPPGMMGNTDQANSDRAKKKSQVLAVADKRSSSVLVSAPTTLMPEIEKMIQQLDANPARKELVQVYDLHGADPSNIRQVLQDLFNRNNTQRTTTTANSLTGDNNPLNTREAQQQSTSSGLTSGNNGASPTGQRAGTTTTGF